MKLFVVMIFIVNCMILSLSAMNERISKGDPIIKQNTTRQVFYQHYLDLEVIYTLYKVINNSTEKITWEGDKTEIQDNYKVMSKVNPDEAKERWLESESKYKPSEQS